MTSEKIIQLHPEYEKLVTRVKQLRTELSMIILERDQIVLHECKNIETAYMLAVGHLEYNAFKLECEVLRLKRKTEIIQALKNRQEKIFIEEIEKALDAEFEDFIKQLQEKLDSMNDALSRKEGKVLNEKDTAEAKKLYREIVKALHPDIHPDIDNQHLELFYHAVAAYENGDLEGLRVIHALIDSSSAGAIKTGFTALQQEGERLASAIVTVKKDIEKIKSEFPYTMRHFVMDKKAIKAKTAELNHLIDEYNEIKKIYESRITEILRGTS